jgi:hypothetical protein
MYIPRNGFLFIPSSPIKCLMDWKRVFLKMTEVSSSASSRNKPVNPRTETRLKLRSNVRRFSSKKVI